MTEEMMVETKVAMMVEVSVAKKVGMMVEMCVEMWVVKMDDRIMFAERELVSSVLA